MPRSPEGSPEARQSTTGTGVSAIRPELGTAGPAPGPLLISGSLLLILVGFSGIFWRYATFDWSRSALGAYSHAYLAAPLWVWLMWRAAHRSRELSGGISKTSILLVAAGLLLKWIGASQDYLVLQGLALIPILAGLSLACFGSQGLRRFAFPLAYLLVIIPLPTFLLDELTIPMRAWHTQAAAWSLEGLGIQAWAEGFHLFVEPHRAIGFRQLFIDQGCSGIRSLTAFLAVGAPFVHLTQHRAGQRLLLYLSLPLFAISSNFLRIFLTAFVAHRWGTEAAQSFFHGAAGFIAFLFALALLIGLTRITSRPEGAQR